MYFKSHKKCGNIAWELVLIKKTLVDLQICSCFRCNIHEADWNIVGLLPVLGTTLSGLQKAQTNEQNGQ